MKKIQLINFPNKFYQDNKEKGNIYFSSLSDPDTPNKFDINIINLNDSGIWTSHQQRFVNGTLTLNSETDLENLSVIINTAENTNIIVILPQSMKIRYQYEFVRSGGKDYQRSVRLRDHPELYKKTVRTLLPTYFANLIFENNETIINNIKLKSSFYFIDMNEKEIITKAKYGERPTTIRLTDHTESAQILVTTLELKEYSAILNYLNYTGLIDPEKTPAPDWINKIAILNDYDLRVEVKEIDTQVKNLIDQKEAKNKELEKNNQYKEVLYETGVNLEKRVIELLEKMLDIDHSNFVDIKKEDFLMEVENTIFIGEIKGFNRNLRDMDLFQLLKHADEYYYKIKDEGKIVEKEKIKPLLIVNHQRNKYIDERIKIHEDQIQRAKRDGMLIIQTNTLLDLFEEFKQEKITTSEIIKLLSEKTGLL